jgi:NADPH-dependent ferric siderophore reductase
MAGMMGRVADLAAKVVLREGAVRAISVPAPGFQRFEVDVAARFAPGQKVQFRVRGIEFRTFTPFDWSPGSVSFLALRHGTGAASPASTWLDGLAPGATVQMFGPRSAIDLSRLPEAPVFVGDETSFALTAAWRKESGQPAEAQLYEVSEPPASAAMLESLGLSGATLVARSPGDAHRDEFARRAVDLVASRKAAAVVLTGNVRSIRTVRDALKAAGLAPVVKAKAHWDPNRAGLD